MVGTPTAEMASRRAMLVWVYAAALRTIASNFPRRYAANIPSGQPRAYRLMLGDNSELRVP